MRAVFAMDGPAKAGFRFMYKSRITRTLMIRADTRPCTGTVNEFHTVLISRYDSDRSRFDT